jgi:hypothetical protein
MRYDEKLKVDIIKFLFLFLHFTCFGVFYRTQNLRLTQCQCRVKELNVKRRYVMQTPNTVHDDGERPTDFSVSGTIAKLCRQIRLCTTTTRNEGTDCGTRARQPGASILVRVQPVCSPVRRAAMGLPN